MFLDGLRWLDEASAVNVQRSKGDEVSGIVQTYVAEVEKISAQEGWQPHRGRGPIFSDANVKTVLNDSRLNIKRQRP